MNCERCQRPIADQWAAEPVPGVTLAKALLRGKSPKKRGAK